MERKGYENGNKEKKIGAGRNQDWELARVCAIEVARGQQGVGAGSGDADS